VFDVKRIIIVLNILPDLKEVFEVKQSERKGKKGKDSWNIVVTKAIYVNWLGFLRKQVADNTGIDKIRLLQNDPFKSKQTAKEYLTARTIPAYREIIDTLEPLVAAEEKKQKSPCRYPQTKAAPLNMETIYLLTKVAKELKMSSNLIEDSELFEFIPNEHSLTIKVKEDEKAGELFHILCKLQNELQLVFPSRNFVDISQKQNELLDGIEVPLSGKEPWKKMLENTQRRIFHLAVGATKQYTELLALKQKA
jgi:hypothetical protein